MFTSIHLSRRYQLKQLTSNGTFSVNPDFKSVLFMFLSLYHSVWLIITLWRWRWQGQTASMWKQWGVTPPSWEQLQAVLRTVLSGAAYWVWVWTQQTINVAKSVHVREFKIKCVVFQFAKVMEEESICAKREEDTQTHTNLRNWKKNLWLIFFFFFF